MADLNVPNSNSNSNTVFNIKNYGAIGNGSSHPASSVLGISTKAQLATYYPWITNSLFQFAARLMVTSEVASGATVIPVVSSLNIPVGASVAGPGIAGGTTISVAPTTVTVNTTTSASVAANATVIPLTSSAGINQGSSCNYNGTIFNGFNLFVQGVGNNSITVIGSSVGAAASGSSVGFSVPPQSVTLSTATTGIIHQGQYIVVTLAMTDTQAAALEMDWLGFQSAIQAAKTNGGGRVYCPAGTYRHNWTLVVPESNGSLAYKNLPTITLNNVDIIGEGEYNTLHIWGNDLGGGRCAISCGDPQATYQNGLGRLSTNTYEGIISDMTFSCLASNGLSSNVNIFGVAVTQMSGMNWGARRRLIRVNFQGFYAGLNIVGDHTHFDSVICLYNYYSLYLDEYGPLYGDLIFTKCMFTGATLAGVGIHANAGSALTMNACYPSGSPYAFYKEAGTLSSNFNGNFIDGVLTDCNMELTGNGIFYDSNGDTIGTSGVITPGTKAASINNLSLDSCYMAWNSGKRIATRPQRGFIDVNYVNALKFKNHPSPISSFTPGTSAIIVCNQVNNTTGGIDFEGDITSLANNLQTAGLPFLSGAQYYSFTGVSFRKIGGVEATLHTASSAITQNTIVEHNGFGGIAPGGTSSSAPAAGYAMHSVSTNGFVMVATKHPYLSVKADTQISYPGYVKKGTTGSVAVCTGSAGVPAVGEVPIGRILFNGGSSGNWTAQIVFGI